MKSGRPLNTFTSRGYTAFLSYWKTAQLNESSLVFNLFRYYLYTGNNWYSFEHSSNYDLFSIVITLITKIKNRSPKETSISSDYEEIPTIQSENVKFEKKIEDQKDYPVKNKEIWNDNW